MRLSILAVLFAFTQATYGLTSSLVHVGAFVSTSQYVAMYAYVPEITAEKPAIVVAIHSCERSAGYYFENTGYASLADEHGFIVIYPNSSTEGGCWDTTSKSSTTHNGGGDSQVITNMVTYAVSNYNCDASRVAVTGSSSGAEMVNLLAGIYPEVFQAASVFSGSYTGNIWPYSGSRPKMMIWHGTIDEIYPYAELGKELHGWSDVLNVTFSQNVTDTPIPGYTKMVYGDGSKLIGISAYNVGHTVPVDAASDLEWFCIFPECDAQLFPKTGTTSRPSSTISSTSSQVISSTLQPSLVGSQVSSVSSAAALIAITASASLNTRTIARKIPPSATSTPSSTTALASIPTHSKLSSGYKVGISIAAIASTLLLAAFAFWIYRRRQSRSTESKVEKTMRSSVPATLARNPSYGAMSIHDVIQSAGNAEKGHRRSARSMDGLLSFIPGDLNMCHEYS